MPAMTDHRRWGNEMRWLTPEERFWFKVQKTDTCWLWTGNLSWGGYGLVRAPSSRSKSGYSSVQASRYAYELTHGPIGNPQILVCHHCDTPACVRPDHLFLGSSRDNTADAVAKGRRFSKLTPAEVLHIREVYASGLVTLDVLGSRYGLNRGTVSRIVNGKLWPHLPGLRREA